MCNHHSKQEESTNPEVDKALYILQHTHNGNDLAPEDLKLVELYMNRRLNEQGMKTLEELYQSVVRGYQKPCYLGVEHMYRDHKGFVYYKGNQVEHYSGTWAYTLDAMHSLRNLQRRCRFLEKKGMEIDMKTTVWQWYKYQPAFAAATIRELQVSAEKQGGFRFTNVLIREPLRGDWEEGFLFPGHVGEEDVWKTERIQDFGSPGSSLLLIKPTLIAPVYMTFGTEPERDATEEEILLSSACFQELLRQGLLSILKQDKADHPINVYLHNPIYRRLEEDRETYFCQGHRFCTYEEVIAGIEDGTVKRTHG